jgi:hypothetical protein
VSGVGRPAQRDQRQRADGKTQGIFPERGKRKFAKRLQQAWNSTPGKTREELGRRDGRPRTCVGIKFENGLPGEQHGAVGARRAGYTDRVDSRAAFAIVHSVGNELHAIRDSGCVSSAGQPR